MDKFIDDSRGRYSPDEAIRMRDMGINVVTEGQSVTIDGIRIEVAAGSMGRHGIRGVLEAIRTNQPVTCEDTDVEDQNRYRTM